jgi:hypothetical protein
VNGVPVYVPHLLHVTFRGGPGDGQTWDGEIEVGRRIASGGRWTPSGVYVVTDRTETGADGRVGNVAVPAQD